MASVFFVRHQAAGVVHEYPFAETPNAEQMAAVGKLCFQRFGFGHVKTPDEPYWLRVVEVELLDTRTLPVVPDRSLSVVSEAGTPKFNVSAAGTVTPKDEV